MLESTALVLLVVRAVAFAVGFMLLPALLPGVRVREMSGALKGAGVGGLLSAVLGPVVLAILKIFFYLPIVISGPVGVFVVQAMVNAGLLVAGSRIVPEVQFDSLETVGWAAVALTALQTVAALVPSVG